jgi:hypothetical protein
MSNSPSQVVIIDLTRVRNLLISFDCGPRNTAVACCDADTFELIALERFDVAEQRFAWPHKLVSRLHTWLSEFLARIGPENEFRVVIERQMMTTPGAQAMTASNCVIETALLMFFESKGIAWSSARPVDVGRYFGLPSGKGSREARKREAVNLVAAIPPEIMSIPSHLKAYYTNESKRDDLADAVLLLLYVLSEGM